MRDYNCAANERRYAHSLIDFFGRKPDFLAFSQMIFNTIITPEDERTGKSDHLLCTKVKAAFLLSIGIEIENAFDDQAV